MRARQKGITFIGWLFLLVPVAIVGYAGIRLVPIYLNHMKVVKAIDQTAQEYAGEEFINPTPVRDALDRRFNIDSIMNPTTKSIDLRREGEHWVLSSEYERVVPLFGNISLLINFNKAVTID